MSDAITAAAVETGFQSVETQLESMQLLGEARSEEECLLRALFETDPTIDRRALQALKGAVLPGTCDWILERSKFIKWRNSTERLLWISGGPGMGKTMLSVYLTEKLEGQSTGHPLVYFFCDHRHNKRNNAVSILRGLVFQLTQLFPRLVSQILPAYRIKRNDLFTSFEELWNVFMRMVESFSQTEVLCILDGLDECEPGSLEVLLRKFSHEITATSPLRTIIVSREHPSSLKVSLSRALRIRLDLDAKTDVSKGLEQYITTRVEELAYSRGYPGPLSEYVKRILREQSNGIYLWVSFVIEDLKSVEISEVEQCLENLPRGLDAIYERMLQQIPVSQQKYIRDILSCCIYSLRPLQLHELAAVLGIEATDSLTRVQVLRGKLSYCGHLLNVTDQVTLVHQSVHDFLIQKSFELTVGAVSPWYSLADEEKEHAWLVSSCISALSRGSPSQSSSDPHPRLPTVSRNLNSSSLRYASKYWMYHFLCSGDKGTMTLDQVPLKFLEPFTRMLGAGLVMLSGNPVLAGVMIMESLMRMQSGQAWKADVVVDDTRTDGRLRLIRRALRIVFPWSRRWRNTGKFSIAMTKKRMRHKG